MKTFFQKLMLLAWAMRKAVALAIFILLLESQSSARAGSWSQLAANAPGNVQLMLLLTDGTVMCSDGGGGNWYKLTPDSTGNYANGSWTNLASMHYQRRFFSSQVLQNGKVMVAGDEYGTDGGGTSEIYDPQSNTWTLVPVPSGLLTIGYYDDGSCAGFRDSDSILLANGTMMVAPVVPVNANQTMIYDPVSNSWSGGPYSLGSQNEVAWTKLPDDSILTINKNSTTSERFIPSLNKWIADTNLPVNLYGVGDELGPGLLLPDGRVFYLGGNTNTAFYSPSGGTNMGHWAAGSVIPNSQACPDAPAAMLVNGNIFFACSALGGGSALGYDGDNTFPTNVSFYEFNPTSNTYSRQNSPTGGLVQNNIPTYQAAMLVLPTGNVLYSCSDSRVYVYNPGATPMASGQPAINKVSWNTDGSLHIIGTLFNGTSAGAAYGDDEQMDSNYPLVRFTSGGTVYYGRTYNWSITSVQTGGRIVTTEVSIPPAVSYSPGAWSLQVVANGNPSAAVTFYSPVWVDFNYFSFISLYFGTYPLPWNTLPSGVSEIAGSFPGGTIAIRGDIQPSTGHETVPYTISTPMTIISVSGPSTIGN